MSEERPIILHPYQRRAVNAVLKSWEQNQSVLLVCATGLGKSIMAASILQARRESGRGMMLAHRKELVSQAAQKIHRVTGSSPDVEMADQWADASFSMWRSPYVVSSVQTQQSGRGGAGRKTRFNPHDFGTLFLDEAHRAVAPSWRAVADYYRQNPNLKICGLTATPNRADEKALGLVFQDCAFEYHLPQAIKDGWLVPVKFAMTPIDGLDISDVGLSQGDLSGSQLGAKMSEDKPLLAHCDVIWKRTEGRKTLVFAASVAHAERMCGIFNTDYASGSARVISGKTPLEQRREVLAAYARKEFPILLNCAVFLEGFDDQSIDVVVPKPTKSTPLYCLDSSTEILTDRGWAGIDDDIGECLVAAWKDGKIDWQKPIAAVRRPVYSGERFVEYSGPRLDFRVTDKHQMPYFTNRRPSPQTTWQKTDAADLAEMYSFSLPISGNQDAAGTGLDTDELWLLGLLAADGTKGKSNHQICLSQSADQPWIAEIDRVACKLGYKFSRREYIRSTPMRGPHKMVSWVWATATRAVKSPPRLSTHWRQLWSKDRLAETLKNMTRDELRAFIVGLNIGDGHKRKHISWTPRTWTITTFKKDFADDLQSLCVRRGYKCNIKQFSYLMDETPRFGYRMHIKDTLHVHIAGKAMKDGRPFISVTNTVPGEMVWCVQVPYGNIVTRRNGKVLIVGNCQMIGRGTRTLPGVVDGREWDDDQGELGIEGEHQCAALRRKLIAESAKPQCLILDIHCQHGSHNLVNAVDALAGDYSDEVVARAKKDALDGNDMTPQERLERAAEAIKRETAIRLERQAIKYAARFRTINVDDPFNAMGVSVKRNNYWAAKNPPTEKMIAMLERHGIDTKGLSKGEAGKIISSIMEKRDKIPATPKMQNVLRRAGFNPIMPMARAKPIVDVLAKNGWQWPDDLPRPNKDGFTGDE